MKYSKKDIAYHFYIVFDRDILQGNIISKDNEIFIFLHRKSTPIREDNEQLVYQQHTDFRRNYRISILKPFSKLEKKIYQNLV